MKPERRAFNLTRITFRAATADGGPGRFGGHAAVFNERTEIGDPKTWGFWEQIDSAAFDRALSEEQDVRLLVGHDHAQLLARTASGTLDLSKDKRGLLAEADLPDTTLGRDTAVLLDRGDLSAMSFGFYVKADKWEEQDDGTELRTILDVDLLEVSIVTFPAYAQTDAAMRDAAEAAGFDRIKRERWEACQARYEQMMSRPRG